MTPSVKLLWRSPAFAGLISLLAACSGDVGTTRTSQPATSGTLSGFVGSPSLTDATITLVAEDGSTALSALSGGSARYTLAFNKALVAPVRVQVEGGVDLITGGANANVLSALSFDADLTTLSVSHLSTLAAQMAACGSEPTANSLARSWASIARFSGLPATLAPQSDTLTAMEVAELMRANITLAESLERARLALNGSGQTTSMGTLLEAIACDLNDDDSLNLSAGPREARSTAAFRAARAAVLTEFIARTPYVGGQAAASLINDTLRQVTGDASVSIQQLPIATALTDQASQDLALMLTIGPAADVDSRLELLDAMSAEPEQASVAVRSTLNSQHLTELWSLPEQISLADSSVLDGLTDRMIAQSNTSGPVVSLSSSASSIASNERVTLSWASGDTDACRATGNWSGAQPVLGSFSTDRLTTSSAYTLQCAGLGGVTGQTLLISVVNGSQPPSVTMSADLNTLQQGQQTMLRWTSQNATACTASGGWSGSQAILGSRSTGALQADSSYTLTCSGPGGSAAATATITVAAAPDPAPTLSLGLSSSSISSGQSVTLNWNTANATSCRAAGGWSGNRPASGSETSGPLTASTTFSLTCSGSGGSVTRSRSVTVSAAPPTPAPAINLSAASSTIDSGASTSLSWNASNASSCTASGGWSGSRSTSGSTTVGPLTNTTTFSLSCSGAGGTASRSTTVAVNTAPAPQVSLNAADNLLDPGATTTLSWSSSNAGTCSASGGWSGSRSTSGSTTVGPLTARTTYTLNCSGSGGNAIAMVSISVNGTLSLSWVAPTENVDGSTLTDLAGYRVYYGESSRSYTGMTEISNPGNTTAAITQPSGDYYVAMTALDQDGNESAYSNEVLKTVQ